MKDIVHIHIPKTGGTWLKHVLNTYVADRLIFTGHTAVDYRIGTNWMLPAYQQVNASTCTIKNEIVSTPADLPGRYEDAVKVSSVRNPFSMLASMYFHNQGQREVWNWYDPAMADLPEGWDQINIIHGFRSFEAFINMFCEPGFPFHHKWYRQNLFFQLFNRSGSCGADLIMRSETLTQATTGWLNLAGYITEEEMTQISQEPMRNVGADFLKSSISGKDYRSCYTDVMREMIEEKCKQELALFGYNFDGPIDGELFIDPIGLRWQT
jgi:hypothetical protein